MYCLLPVRDVSATRTLNTMTVVRQLIAIDVSTYDLLAIRLAGLQWTRAIAISPSFMHTGIHYAR